MSTIAAPAPAGWLKSRGFDINFIGLIAAVAIIVGVTAYLFPQSAEPIFFMNVWFLGYHHVIATYTRLVFDKGSAKEYIHLLTTIPAIVLIFTAGLGFMVGVAALITVFFHWQWFHYTRQSWGIACAYRRQATKQPMHHPKIAEIVFWSIPIFGLIHRSWQGWDAYWSVPMMMLPISDIVYYAFMAYAGAAVCYWIWSMVHDLKHKQFAKFYHAYLASHFAIFFISYYVIPDLSMGWLVVNIWHNAQYIAFVWLYNQRKFKDGVDPKAKFLSTISQPKNVWLYFTVCMVITTLIYGTFKLITVQLAPGTEVLAMLILYQTINYHHYIADSMIWKTRKKKTTASGNAARPYNID